METSDKPTPTSSEPATEMEEKLRLTFCRPRSQNPDLPWYAPERDVALQAMRMLGEAELLTRDERYRDYEPMLQALRQAYPCEGTDREVIDRAGMACLEFVADCWGQVYVPGKARDEWPTAPKQLEAHEALGKLVSSAPRAGLMFILAIQGYFLMDFYYMGIHQSRQLGMPLDKSSQQIYSQFDLLCRSAWFQKPIESQSLSDARRSVAAALQAGIPIGTLHAIVDRAAADLEV